jgi:hypothetical protein
MRSGTVIEVVGFEQGPVAVSADSREYFRDGRTEEVCKITALGDRFIVGVTGYAGNGKDFSILGDAREVFESLSPKATKEIGIIFVNAWRDRVLEHVNRELHDGKIEPEVLNQRLANAITVGPNEKGVVTLWAIRISTGSNTAFSDIVTKDQWPQIASFGDNKIAIEAGDPTTEKGREWNRRLHSGAGKLPGNERSTYWSRWLVQFSIENLAPENIGGLQIKTVAGPIDTLTMDRAGNIKWGKHKKKCH